MNNKEDNIREVNEALIAGERALTALSEAENSLSKARGYGVWDMLGGGLISGMLKHSKIDKAQEQMETAKRELKRFRKELGDVDMSCDVQINFDNFSKFADYFFDGFLVDFMVQRRIKDSQEQVAKMKSQVQDAIKKLRQLKNYVMNNS